MSNASTRAFYALLAATVMPAAPPATNPCSDYILRAPSGGTYTVAQDVAPTAPTGQTHHVCRTVIS